MPSTYGNGGEELIATGEKSGEWGNITNENIQILDRMAMGVAAISLSGTTHTLTTTDGALSDGQYKGIIFGGSPSGTNTVTVEPNDAQRVYIMYNISGESIVVEQGGGTGNTVTIDNGKSMLVACDGTGSNANVYDASGVFQGYGTIASQDSNNVSITGGAISGITDLAVADGGTGASDAATALVNLGLTSTAAEINTLDGYTGDVDDFNTLPVTTLGTSEASKVVTADANGDVEVAEEFKAKSYNETFQTANSSSNTTTFNLESANVFSTTLTENTTFAFTNPPTTGTAYSFTIKIVQDASASGYTVTWPAAVDWPDALEPTLTDTASGVDIFVFFTHDGGTTWYGFTAGQNMG